MDGGIGTTGGAQSRSIGSMTPPRPHPIDILWQPGTLLSIFAAGELLALTLVLANDDPGMRLVRFGLFSFAIQWIALVALGLLYLVRGELSRQPAGAVAGFGLLAIVAVAIGSIQLGWVVLGDLWNGTPGAWWRAGLRFLAALLCMALVGLLALRSQWLSRQMALRAKQAELDLLRARVDPHFLFNALNTASALLPAAPAQAEQVLLALSEVFRAALSARDAVALEEEVALTRGYLQIEALRLGERLRVDWRVPSPLPDARIPVLALQTLAENGIRHGIERLGEGGELRVDIRADGDRLRLRVENPLPSEADAAGAGHQIGLAATRARIEALPEAPGRLDTASEGGRFFAEIVLPLPPAPPAQRADGAGAQATTR